MTIITTPRTSELDELQALIEEARRRARRRRRRMAACLLAPVLAGAALYAGLGGRTPGPSRRAARSGPARAAGSSASQHAGLGLPGMPGTVWLQALVSPTSRRELVVLQQCNPCRTAMAMGTFTDWVALTDNGGRTWSVRPTSPLGATVQFADRRDGWSSDGYVTHDGGFTWLKAHVLSRYPVQSISIVGGTVWAVASGPCRTRTHCVGFGDTVLVGSARRNTLAPAAHQPFTSGYKLGGIVAVNAGSASVTALGPNIVQMATRDGGRSWQRVALPCHAGAGSIIVGPAGTLWTTCVMAGGGQLLARSWDGGRDWTAPSYRAPADIYPVSSRVLWGLNERGDVTRSADAGTHWHTVWTPPANRATFHAFARWAFPALAVRGKDTATVAILVSGGRGANLAVYRTVDGGHVWTRATTRLPTRPPASGHLVCQPPACYRTFPAGR